jgi:hypothetical protein
MLNPTKDRLMTIDNVAMRILKSPSSVRRMIGAAQFRCCKVGASIRIWESSVEDYLKRQTEQWHVDNGPPEDFESQ